MLYKFRYAKHGPGCYPLDLLWPMAPCSAKCGGCTDLPRNKSRIQRYVWRWFSLFSTPFTPPYTSPRSTQAPQAPSTFAPHPIHFAIQSFHSIHTIQILRRGSTVISAGVSICLLWAERRAVCFALVGPNLCRHHTDGIPKEKRPTKIDQTLDERVSDGHGEKLISALVAGTGSFSLFPLSFVFFYVCEQRLNNLG